MSFLDRFRQPRILDDHQKQMMARKHIPSRAWSVILSGAGIYTTSRWDKRQIVEQAYERNPAFHAAVNIIAQTVASMPLVVKSKKAGRTHVVREHPMLKALQANTSTYDLLDMMTKYYCTLGESHAQIVMGGNGKPLGVIVLPEIGMRNIQGDARNPIAGYELHDHGIEEFGTDEIIHVLKPSLSRYFESMPPAIPLQEAISLNNAATTWNKNVAQNGGVPPIVAKARTMDKKEAQELKAGWREQRGAGNAGDLTVVPDDIELEKLDVKPHEAEWEKAILLTMRVILMNLNVSSSLLNDAGNKTYNNVKDSRKALYTEACIPVARCIISAITRKMSRYYEDSPELDLDLQNIEALQEDKERQMRRLVAGVNAGILTANEARSELGLKPASGVTADVLQNSSIINNIPQNETPNDDDTEDSEPI